MPQGPYLPLAQNQLPGGQPAPGYSQQDYDQALGPLAKRLMSTAFAAGLSPTPTNLLLSLLGAATPNNKYSGLYAAATKEPGPLAETITQELIPYEQSVQPKPTNQVFLHQLVKGQPGQPSYAVLSQQNPISADEFKQAFFPEGSMPEGVHVDVSKLHSNLRPDNQYNFRMDFWHENKGAVSAPNDFHSRFGMQDQQQIEGSK